MLTRQLAGELAPQVLVNAIAPGLFPSKMTATILDAGADTIARQIPLQRVGRTEDIAGISVFLASPASSYITGAVIPIDGGLTALAKLGSRDKNQVSKRGHLGGPAAAGQSRTSPEPIARLAPWPPRGWGYPHLGPVRPASSPRLSRLRGSPPRRRAAGGTPTSGRFGPHRHHA